MPKLVWDKSGEHFYENGVDHGVLFVKKTTVASGQEGTGVGEYEKGVAWNGLVSVSLSPEGADPNDIYADNIKYLSLLGIESVNATIEAYQSPKEFDVCDGSAELVTGMPGVTVGQQPRRPFALVFRTKVGNDAGLNAYKLHILYGCLATPADRDYETINDSPDAMTLSWDVTTVPVEIEDEDAVLKATALVTIDSSKFTDATKAKLTAIENSLFGTDGVSPAVGTDPTLLLPSEIITILTSNG